MKFLTNSNYRKPWWKNKQRNKKVKKFRTNNGLEFYSNMFGQCCGNEGLTRRKTNVNTPLGTLDRFILIPQIKQVDTNLP